MIDPTKGVSPAPPVRQAEGTTSAPRETKRGQERAAADRVELSEQALSLQDVDRSAALTRQLLETNDLSLGLDLKKLDEMA